jgi:hypothetical protein
MKETSVAEKSLVAIRSHDKSAWIRSTSIPTRATAMTETAPEWDTLNSWWGSSSPRSWHLDKSFRDPSELEDLNVGPLLVQIPRLKSLRGTERLLDSSRDPAVSTFALSRSPKFK